MSDGRGSAESTEGFSVERIARNDAIFREANEQIGETAEEYGAETSIPFLCECADQNCREIVRLTLEQFREVRSDPRHFINMPGHEASAHGWVEVIARTDGYVTVAKIGRAGDIAETLADDDEPTSVPPARRDTQRFRHRIKLMAEREARVGMNEALFRAVNERIEDVNESFATLTDAFEVVCECGNAGCVTQIRIASDAYERVRAGATLFIVVPGHETAEIEEIVDKQDAYYVVRKEADVAKRVAKKTDPRSP